MSDEAALLKAIIAHPDEDTPRLVYADWLDEHGRSVEAEFVRTQCRIAAISPADPEWAGLIDREADLLWQGPLRNDPLPAPFHIPEVYSTPYRDEDLQFIHRGFPFLAYVTEEELLGRTPAQFAEDLAHLFTTTPIRGVDFLDIPAARFERVISCSTFAEVRGLGFDVSDQPLAPTTWKKLLDSPAAEHIEQLYIRNDLAAEVLAAFASGSAFRRLRRFSLRGLRASAAEVRAWLEGDWVRQLRYVEACLPREPDVAAAIAAGLAEMPELHSLHTAHRTAEQLARLPAASFPKLASLRVWGADYTIARFRELLSAEWFGRLRALDLGGLGDQAVSALTKHPVAKELFHLRLHNCSLGKAGLRTIARPGAFPELIGLDLGGCVGGFRGKSSATPKEVQAFVSGLHLPHLKSLNLASWPLGDDGAKALASNTGLPNLTYLNLRSAHLGPKGKKALAESPLGRAEICGTPN
jgi:uncharacterized protein (TIGR02996 family)